jgi:glycosyltransferase involved in cell wall biosynthesis
MLGWEFPPHISGGLGTACYGLTRGLAHHGVEVLFVAPRLYGDEDSSVADLIAADRVEIPLGADEGGEGDEVARLDAAARLDEAARIVADPGRVPRSAVYAHLAELLSIQSPLLPYLTEHAYARRLAAVAAGEPAPEEGGGGAYPERAVPPAPGAASPQRAAKRAAKRRTTTLAFGEHYGPDLYLEVGRFALAVAEIARTRTFDVIHAHDWMTFPAGLLAKEVSGRPLVAHVHACEYDRSGDHPNERIRDLEQAGIDGADRIVTVSHYTASILRHRYRVDRTRQRVVHNAVTHREQAERLHAEKSIDEKIVLFLGRVTFQKGPDYFVDAARLVVDKEPRVKFVISGSGDMLAPMIERVARLGLSRHVHFTGFLRGREVERMYALADLYVMPSVSEPFGISPLEAMALDVPVIVSRQSGVSEILTNALKFDFWDVRSLADKILACLRRPALVEQLVEEGREEVRRMRWELQGRRMLSVYQEVSP